ncbi:lysine--tRNA ligase, partial [Candidatus Woesearchaeota archaeon]|nr:lysine--tRNA ligase [Candidatus Woesearchaeota archaeon]
MAEDKLINDRLEKLKKLRELGINPYPYSYNKTYSSAQIHEEHLKLNAGEETKKKVRIAGRITSLRVMGNVSFAHLLDNDGSIQVFFSKDLLGEDYNMIRKLVDLGDFIGVEGNVFRTKMGEITVKAHSSTFLSKSIRPLPEKFHGLQDPEIKYRKRYLDLITDKETKNTFVMRSKIIAAVREFLDGKGYVEVDTPTLQPIYGGARAKPFKTHINAWSMDLYLSISPELYLKRLIVGGMEKV